MDVPHVALLRGINVGGKNKLPMRDLVPLVEHAGGRSVRTYIQSGNVLFEAHPEAAEDVAHETRRRIQEAFGFDVPIMLRTAEEMQEAVAKNPFHTSDSDPKHLAVGFLAEAPSPEAIASLDPDRSDVDRFMVLGRELYLHLPGGMARTKLTTAYFDRRLETVVTVRNWRTVTRLIELLG